jgi:hypothetical protein
VLEDRLELAPHLAQHVHMAAAQGRGRERDVDGLGLADVGQPGCLVLGAARGQRRSIARLASLACLPSSARSSAGS